MMKTKNGAEIAETAFTEPIEEPEQTNSVVDVPEVTLQTTEGSDDCFEPSPGDNIPLLPVGEMEPSDSQQHLTPEDTESSDVITPLKSRPYTWSEANFDRKPSEEEEEEGEVE